MLYAPITNLLTEAAAQNKTDSVMLMRLSESNSGFRKIGENFCCTKASRKPRADAQRNRVVILEVAKHVFTRRGVEASADEIAKRAKIGQGTSTGTFLHAMTY